MKKAAPGVILKFDYIDRQTVGEITKIIGLTSAKNIVPVIDTVGLDANPRFAKTGPVTDAIQESISSSPNIFPFKTKGILLAASRLEYLEQGLIKIMPDDPGLEGILDGGHNILAIGLYILKEALGPAFSKGTKTWDEFKVLWRDNRNAVSELLDKSAKGSDASPIGFYIPVELLVPRDAQDEKCVECFKRVLPDICSARNNNVQLEISAIAHQLGYFDALKEAVNACSPVLSRRIEWKTNDGGVVKVQDLIALCWIPLGLVTPVKNDSGRIIEPISPVRTYTEKNGCLRQFERLMRSPDVTSETSGPERRPLINTEVGSALRIAAELPELYDYIFEMFPKLYSAGRKEYAHIPAVKRLNENRREKATPFLGNLIEILSPEGFIMPLVYGLQTLMEKCEVDGRSEIRWSRPPLDFLRENLEKIIGQYAGILSICGYDPQKVGHTKQNYSHAISGYKMAIAGIL